MANMCRGALASTTLSSSILSCFLLWASAFIDLHAQVKTHTRNKKKMRFPCRIFKNAANVGGAQSIAHNIIPDGVLRFHSQLSHSLYLFLSLSPSHFLSVSARLYWWSPNELLDDGKASKCFGIGCLPQNKTKRETISGFGLMAIELPWQRKRKL